MFKVFWSILFVIVILGVVGEIKCILKLIDSDWKAPYKREAIYGIATCTTLGAVVGWIDIKDE